MGEWAGWTAALAAVCFVTAARAEPPAGQPVAPVPPAPATAAPATAAPAGLPVGTEVRLMILREVSSRTAKPGDRIRLRVIEPVVVGGVTRVPVGATAWGEVTLVEANGSAGKSGKLSARLLHVETPDGPVPLKGERENKGDNGTGGLVMALVGFGPLGLLHQGDSGRLKAGELVTGTVVGPAPAAPAPSQAVSSTISQP